MSHKNPFGGKRGVTLKQRDEAKECEPAPGDRMTGRPGAGQFLLFHSANVYQLLPRARKCVGAMTDTLCRAQLSEVSVEWRRRSRNSSTGQRAMPAWVGKYEGLGG